LSNTIEAVMPLLGAVVFWTIRTWNPPSRTTPVQKGSIRIEFPDGIPGAEPQLAGGADDDGEVDPDGVAEPDGDGDGDPDAPELADGAGVAVSHVIAVPPIVETPRALP
jgi:hypothetical protein